MIVLQEIKDLHKTLIELFGGSIGIRDLESLKSAISRPFQTFENKDLYPGTIQKAAALIESIVSNHPFIDGNKRTGYVTMRIFLISNGFDIKASQDEKYQFVIAIASGKLKLDKINEWLEEHIIEQ